MEGLTPKQEKFCLEYMTCGSINEAHRRAGYSCKTEKHRSQVARRVFDLPKVQARIMELQNEMYNEKIADIKEIQEFLTQTVRQIRDEEVVASECNGKVSKPVIVRKKAALRDAVKAAELLAKMQGAFVERYDLGAGVPVVIKDDLEDLDDKGE